MSASSSVHVFDFFSSSKITRKFPVERVSHIVDDFILLANVMPSILIEVHGILIENENLNANLQPYKLQNHGFKGTGCTQMSSWTYGATNEITKSHHVNILKLYPIT
ncbi:hypothetical protein MAR_001488 [Mya arenaria]|uniref:Uncharacterized protein n=1 Tax=Mya arenaria TaxID=6604 RepID=A0ABY7FC25_MYAAR|nr:hypothetical protein MAR_001488 [Mya arenaria]